jgi:hypothetical protein
VKGYLSLTPMDIVLSKERKLECLFYFFSTFDKLRLFVKLRIETRASEISNAVNKTPTIPRGH